MASDPRVGILWNALNELMALQAMGNCPEVQENAFHSPDTGDVAKGQEQRALDAALAVFKKARCARLTTVVERALTGMFTCQACGKPIPPERMKIVWTDLCCSCAQAGK